MSATLQRENVLVINYSAAAAPVTSKFLRSSAFIRGLMGPFGSGKSTACVMDIICRGMSQAVGSDGVRRSRWLVVRNTYQELRDTTIKTFHQWFPPDLFGSYNKVEHNYKITRLAPDVEIEVIFLALDSLQDARKLLSLELTGAWINEAREVPRAVLDMLQGRVGRFPAMRDGGCTWAGIIMDTNPPDTDSWWYRLFEEIKPENAVLFRQPGGRSATAENLNNLPKNYYANLCVDKDPEFVKIYVNGEYGYVQEGRPVYPEYNDALHCVDVAATRGLPIYRGWDFGLTPACVFLQFSASGRVHVIGELVSENSGIESFSDAVLLHCSQNYAGFTFRDYGDPAGTQRAQTDEKSCFDILHAKNVDIEGGEQSLVMRLESVKKPLNSMIDGRPGMYISPRCKIIRKGFQGGYRYRRINVSGDKFTDFPDKNSYSHAHDALQYPLTRIIGPLLKERQPANYDNYPSSHDERGSDPNTGY